MVVILRRNKRRGEAVLRLEDEGEELGTGEEGEPLARKVLVFTPFINLVL